MRGINHGEDFGWASALRFGGGGSTSTNTIQNAAPWTGQQGYLTDIYGQAQHLNALSQEGQGPQYYPNSTYVPLNGQEQGLMSNLINYSGTGGATNDAASQNLLTGALSPNYTSATGSSFNQSNPTIGSLGAGSQIDLSQPAYTAGQDYLANTINGTPTLGAATGAFGAGNDYLTSTLNGTSPTQGYYANMISGANLDPFKAPGFQSVVNNTLASVLPSVESSFISGNRSSGGLAARAATMAATDAIGGLANQNYLQEQQLQQGAAQASGAQQAAAAAQAAQNLQQQQQLQAGAAGQAASNQGTALNTTLGAGSLASNNLLTQQGNQIKGDTVAPLVDQGITSNMGTALTTSGMTQQDQQNQLNAAIAAYNYGQMMPYNNLGMYEQLIAGAGNPGSSTSATTTQPYFTNPVANIASIGAGALSAGAAVNSLFPSFFPAIGAAFGFSDRDLKTDIHEIGETHSGFPLYTFRYRWEGPMSMRIGVMAQDVEKTRPHAVIHTPVGRMVNYLEALAA